jgi:glycosyltransferase involved in cell wall biosynthesis
MAVGALEANKRFDVLVEAVAGLSDVTTVVVGDGPMRASLSAGLRGRADVVLVGAVPPSELPRYYRAADVVVLPGRGGMVISEAMAHGRPVIVHQADGTECDLVVDGETGLQLRKGDAPAIRAAIEALARDPDRAERMGAKARARVADELGIQVMVERILEACQRARDARTATPSS